MAVRGLWGPWVGPWLLTFSVLLAASNNAHGFDDDQARTEDVVLPFMPFHHAIHHAIHLRFRVCY